MIDITIWMQNFLQTLNKTFANRVWFVGLQGSYGRGEATETSDIDVVVILDELSAADIQTYNTMLNSLPNRELICGFLSGKQEIMNWEPSDLFQFCHDTTPSREVLTKFCVLLTKVLSKEPSKSVFATSITDVFTIYSVIRARIF